jgi:aspartyl-tRNA(Asn)/glutamyl-tRNA(Gln) amidotransferase subunit A
VRNIIEAAKRVLLVDAGIPVVSTARMMPADGMLIVMEPDAERGAALRRELADAGLGDRATVIIGDPARMLYKIAGPFDLIVSNDHARENSLRTGLEKLLGPQGHLLPAGDIDDLSVEIVMQNIRRFNPSINAFIAVFNPPSESELPAGPLHGRPISIKDLIDVKGTPTTVASRAREGHVADADATVVRRLRAAGAAIVGKANLHEFALGTTNEESAFGPARNPYDLTRSPGGSSGGSGAAVAARMSWASIGSDTGGSIRIPAAACGVVGLKPAFGEIPTTGVFPLSVSLDHVGPLARNVSDAWLVYEVLKGVPPSPQVAAPMAGLRLGKLGGYFLEKLDVDVRRRFDEAISRMIAAGAAIVDVAIPHADIIAPTYVRVALTEAYAVHAKLLERHGAAYSPGVRARIESGRDITQDEYVSAQRNRAILRDEVTAALSDCDALVLPSLAIPAPKIGSTDPDIRPLMLRLSQLFNLTGHPAISLPCGLTSEGLPCGLQLVGRREGTIDLLRVSLACEKYADPDGHAPAAFLARGQTPTTEN